MNFRDPITRTQTEGKECPRFKGSVKLILKDEITGKVDTIEKHNTQTNALPDIFANNFGGLLNYQNFADLYASYLGGVLVFADPLDSDPTSYGIPAQNSNACVAHAGQTPLISQADDTTRGNPDDTKLVLTNNSVKLVWTWSPSAGVAQRISAIGLTHSDVGSFGCGVNSTAQRSLNPFADVGCLTRSYSYGDNASAITGIDGGYAYTFYKTSGTTVDIFKTPINNTLYKLQGGSLLPITDYTSKITATLPSTYGDGTGACYYHWDFTNNALILFGVPASESTTLYKDVINLTNGTVTHSDITVTGALLWRFTTSTRSGIGWGSIMTVPTRAIVYNNHFFVYGLTGTGDYDHHPTKIFSVNLANTADISEVDTTALPQRLDSENTSAIHGRVAWNGGIIAHESFLLNSDILYPLTAGQEYYYLNTGKVYAMPDSISSPVIGLGRTDNILSICKLYLATKFNLDTPVEKTAAQSMTIEYTLTQTN